MKKLLLSALFMSAVSMAVFAGNYQILSKGEKEEIIQDIVQQYADVCSDENITSEFKIKMLTHGVERLSRVKQREGLLPYSPLDIAIILNRVLVHYGFQDPFAADQDNHVHGGGGAGRDSGVMQEIPAPPALPVPSAEMLAVNGTSRAAEKSAKDESRFKASAEMLAAKSVRSEFKPSAKAEKPAVGRAVFNQADLQNAAGKLKKVERGGGGGGAAAVKPQQGRGIFANVDLNAMRKGLKPVKGAPRAEAAPAAEENFMQKALRVQRAAFADDSSDDDSSGWGEE